MIKSSKFLHTSLKVIKRIKFLWYYPHKIKVHKPLILTFYRLPRWEVINNIIKTNLPGDYVVDAQC